MKTELTARELDVLELIYKGHPLNNIGEMLGVTRNTIATHIAHILQKTGADNQYELMAKRIAELEQEIENLRLYYGGTIII